MNKGFTLIELVVVIAIVAVLAAVALPRFASLQRDARVGHLTSVRGAVAAASTLAHAKVLTRNGQPDSSPCAGGGSADNRPSGAGTLCTENGLIALWNGYPATLAILPTTLPTTLPTDGAEPPGIVSAAGLGTVFRPTLAELRSEGYAVSVSGPTTTIARADARQPALCSFNYRQAPAAGSAATISSLQTAGC